MDATRLSVFVHKMDREQVNRPLRTLINLPFMCHGNGEREKYRPIKLELISSVFIYKILRAAVSPRFFAAQLLYHRFVCFSLQIVFISA